MLLFLASAHATQLVDGASLTLHQAVELAGTDPDIRIATSYDASVESPLVVTMDLSIQSATAGTAVQMPALLVLSADVTLTDLEMVGETETFTTPFGLMDCGGCALWASESELTVNRMSIEGHGGEVAPLRLTGSSGLITSLTMDGNGAPNTVFVERGNGGTDLIFSKARLIDNAGPLRVESEVSSDMQVVIDDSTFLGNLASEPTDAPDIHVVNAKHIQIEDSSFTESSGSNGAGSISIQDTLTVQLGNLSFQETVGGQGGAVRMVSNVLQMQPWVYGIDVEDSSGDNGGAFHISGEFMDASLSDIRVVDTSSQNGGALYVDGAHVECDNCGFYGTQAIQAGGAVAAHGQFDVRLERTWICGSIASSVGSAIFSNGSGDLALENVVVQDPRGAASGLELTGATRVHLQHTDLLGRNGTVGIGGDHGSFTMLNSIVDGWGTWADGSSDSAADIQWNLWNAGTSASADVRPDAGDLLDDPAFVDEFELGDCTTPPHLDQLVPSPAIDAGGPPGVCFDWDETGSRCDIGAFGGEGGKPDQAPWNEGWDGHIDPIDTGDSGETGGVDSGTDSGDSGDSEPPDSRPDDSDPPDDVEPGASWVSGGCHTGAAFLVLMGLGLATRRR